MFLDVTKKTTTKITSDFRSSFCITMCLALLPEMLMCSWSLSISCPVPSWSVSSFSSFFSCWLEPPAWLDSTGGDASTGFTRPTWGTIGMVGRTGVTPFQGRQTQSVTMGMSTVQLLVLDKTIPSSITSTPLLMCQKKTLQNKTLLTVPSHQGRGTRLIGCG